MQCPSLAGDRSAQTETASDVYVYASADGVSYLLIMLFGKHVSALQIVGENKRENACSTHTPLVYTPHVASQRLRVQSEGGGVEGVIGLHSQPRKKRVKKMKKERTRYSPSSPQQYHGPFGIFGPAQLPAEVAKQNREQFSLFLACVLPLCPQMERRGTSVRSGRGREREREETTRLVAPSGTTWGRGKR